jgi:hypothetical protein
LTEVATASGKPSNVATMVAVTRGGEPVVDLGIAAFTVSENDQSLNAQAVSLRTLDPTTAATFHTVLLVDLSHTTNDERKRQLSRAAAAFVRRVRQKQAVTVLAFDGAARTRLVGEFGADPSGAGPDQLETLVQMTASDPSRNLNGAVLSALDANEAFVERSGRTANVGTIVVFSRGPDIAGRVRDSDYSERIQQSNRHFVLIRVAGDPTNDGMDALNSRGSVESKTLEDLGVAFENAAILVNRLASQYYLLSYCSPARAGERRLRVEVRVTNPEGNVESDEFERTFDATGFAPNCNSNAPPKFAAASRGQGDRAADHAAAPSAAKPPAPNTPIEPLGSVAPGTDPSVADPEAPGSEIEVPPPKKRGYAP